MEWRDQGILLAVRLHGESAAILDVLTATHGRWSGLIHGGASRRKRGFLQPGAELSLHWRGKQEETLGVFSAEPIRARAGALLDNPLGLSALSSVCALLSAFLPEREPNAGLYAETAALLDQIAEGGDPSPWLGAYAGWELRLLGDLGFGLDLERCAATGQTQELIWVSPRSGRAVSRAAGAPYADRLLPLPPVLRLGGPCAAPECVDALAITGLFLGKWAARAIELPDLPPARRRFAERLTRRAAPPSPRAAAG